MGLIKTIRPADSPFLHSVTLYQCNEAADDWAVPDGSWDLVMMRQNGKVQVLLTGQTTEAVRLQFQPGDEFLTLSFRASSFLTRWPADRRVDQGTLLQQLTSSTFQIGADRFETPRFDDAEALVGCLERAGLLDRDDFVEGLLAGRPLAASLRSLQRHFLRTTGLPAVSFRQIRRAHEARDLLLSGVAASEAALEAGYSDQPHMIRSLKRIFGQTPVELVQTPH